MGPAVPISARRAWRMARRPAPSVQRMVPSMSKRTSFFIVAKDKSEQCAVSSEQGADSLLTAYCLLLTQSRDLLRPLRHAHRPLDGHRRRILCQDFHRKGG